MNTGKTTWGRRERTVICKSEREASKETNFANAWSWTSSLLNVREHVCYLSCPVSGICYGSWADLYKGDEKQGWESGPETNWEEFCDLESLAKEFRLKGIAHGFYLISLISRIFQNKRQGERQEPPVMKRLEPAKRSYFLWSGTFYCWSWHFKMATKSFVQKWRARKAGRPKTMSCKKEWKQLFMWSLDQRIMGWVVSTFQGCHTEKWSLFSAARGSSSISGGELQIESSAHWKEESSSSKSFPTMMSSLDETFSHRCSRKRRASSRRRSLDQMTSVVYTLLPQIMLCPMGYLVLQDAPLSCGQRRVSITFPITSANGITTAWRAESK